jgi:hypothetical protein
MGWGLTRAMLCSAMGESQGEPPGEQLPRCTLCDDVIGVYEPLVHIDRELARRTSRAAEPGVTSSAGKSFHLDCYERLVGEA